MYGIFFLLIFNQKISIETKLKKRVFSDSLFRITRGRSMIKKRLYLHDAYRKDFEATIIDKIAYNDNYGVVLNETAFYPTSGGQQHDTGLINEIAVVDVMEQDGEIVHILPELPGTKEVSCQINCQMN